VVTLRPATASDAAFVDGLTRRTMDANVRKTWADEVEVAYYFEKNRFVADATRIIQSDGRDVGRLTLLESPAEVFVDNIHLSPECQGQGLGAAVLQQVIDSAQTAGKSVRLQCLVTNRALGLYLRLGFQEYERTATHAFLRIPAPTR
jgi:ribosomal protein S18 acetylase RimI-like enzyme